MKHRLQNPCQDDYTEKHHIFPKSIFGNNNVIVVLSAREHYLAHAMLSKCASDKNTKIKMEQAFWMMNNVIGKSQDRYVNSTLYEHSKKSYSKMMSDKFSGEGNVMYGKTHTEKTRKKFSEDRVGRGNHQFGKSHTKEHRNKISNALKGKSRPEYVKQKCREAMLGRSLTKEHIERLKGPRKPQLKVSCVFCKRTGGLLNMKRYHMDNCKHRRNC